MTNPILSGISRAGRLVVCPTIAAIALAALGCSHGTGYKGNLQEESAEAGSVVVRVQGVERRKVSTTVRALGRCEALPASLAMLTPAIEGQVTKLLVEQGRLVDPGQPIVQLDDTVARSDVAEKVAMRDSAVAALDLLRSVPRSEEQQAHKLAIEHADIAATQAEAVVNRLRPLRERGEVSQQQLFDAEQALQQAKVQQRLDHAQYDLLMAGPREEAIAEAKSKVAVDEAAVATAQEKLNLFTIRAPIKGVLDSLSCRRGQTIAIGSPIGEVLDVSRVLVRVWLPTKDGRLAHEGQTAQVQVVGSEAVSSADSPSSIEGEVTFVGAATDPQTGNVPVDILVDNAGSRLLIGETVRTEIVVDEASEVLAVPATAIHDEGDGAVVSVVRDGKAVVLHPALGASNHGWVVVTDVELKEGDSVIVEGAYNLPDGAEVEAKPADIAPDAKPAP